MKASRLTWIAARIEWHWAFILLYRKRGGKLIERGVPLCSEKLIRISKRINRHGTKAMQLQDLFESEGMLSGK